MPTPAAQQPPLLVDGPDRVVAGCYVFAVFALSVVAAGFGQAAFFGPAWWGWAVLTYAALGGILVYGFPVRRRAWAAAVVVGGFWLGLGVWVAYGWAHGLGGRQYWLAWLGGWALTTAAAVTWATPSDIGLPMHPAPSTGPAGSPPPEPDDGWGQVIEAATKGRVAGVTTRHVTPWESGCGYSAYLTLPGDGSTDETLQPYQAGIAAVLDVPRGGGVTVLPDPDGGARAIRVDVLETDAMADDIAYPGLD